MPDDTMSGEEKCRAVPELAGSWQTIDTLPDNGEQVLLYMPGGVCIAPATPLVELSRADRLKLAKAGHWPDYQRWRPTHWMPLPAPPAERDTPRPSRIEDRT